MLESHLDICRLLVNEILEEEVAALCGARYSHEKPNAGRYSRWGYNPGSVRIGGSSPDDSSAARLRQSGEGDEAAGKLRAASRNRRGR